MQNMGSENTERPLSERRRAGPNPPYSPVIRFDFPNHTPQHERIMQQEQIDKFVASLTDLHASIWS